MIKKDVFFKFILMPTLISAFILPSCIRKPLPEYQPNNVDLSPIIDLNIPIETDDIEKLIDVNRLELLNEVSFPAHTETLKTNDLDFLYQSGSTFGSDITISFEIFLHDEIDSASHWVKDACDDNFNGRPITLSGQGEIDGTPYFYCVYALKLQRGDPSSFWRSTGKYSGHIFIQKGNMDIVISEYTETLDRQTFNDAIKEFAEMIHTGG